MFKTLLYDAMRRPTTIGEKHWQGLCFEIWPWRLGLSLSQIWFALDTFERSKRNFWACLERLRAIEERQCEICAQVMALEAKGITTRNLDFKDFFENCEEAMKEVYKRTPCESLIKPIKRVEFRGMKGERSLRHLTNKEMERHLEKHSNGGLFLCRPLLPSYRSGT